MPDLGYQNGLDYLNT